MLAAGPSKTKSKSSWTFLTNHAHVIILLFQDPTLLLKDIALKVGITERAVHRIIGELEEGGYLNKERTGRKNYYTVHIKQHLRHPVESHCTIGELLRLIAQL
jgi:DNA-binding MarR family transcriptional regulator